MASKNNSWKAIMGVIVLSFVFGVGGSLVSDQYVLPYLYRTLYPQYVNDAMNSGRVIVEPTKVIEREAQSSIISTVKEVSPSVVSIVVTKELTTYYNNPYDLFFNDPFFGYPRQPSNEPKTERRTVGGGSGFIVTSDGLVLTNKHVVDDEKADYTIITKDGTEYRGEVVTKDPINDMAIVRMKTKDNAKVDNMPVVRFTSNVEQIEVGQMVVAIGNALAEFDNTVTAGVVSAKGRNISASNGMQSSVEVLKGLIQTDASINPGNSGGPLVNLSGEVIGMNTAVASNAQGIGFAIPLDEPTITKTLNQIKQYGRIVRPFLGVRFVPVTPQLNEQFNLGTDTGAWIRSDEDLPAVVADTPAAKAGLKGGDIVLKINGESLTADAGLQELIGKYNPGDTITLLIMRDGREMEIKVVLEERMNEATNSNVNSNS